MGCLSTSPGPSTFQALRIATLENIAQHYGIEFFDCGKDTNNKQSQCVLPSHPKKKDGTDAPRSGKKLRWFCDDRGQLLRWYCFNEDCVDGRFPLGDDAIAFVAHMEGVGYEEAVRMICGGLFSAPSPTPNPSSPI